MCLARLLQGEYLGDDRPQPPCRQVGADRSQRVGVGGVEEDTVEFLVSVNQRLEIPSELDDLDRSPALPEQRQAA